MERREGGNWDSASPEGPNVDSCGLVAWTAKGSSLTSRAFIFVQAVLLRKALLSLSVCHNHLFFIFITLPEFPDLSELQLKAPVVLGYLRFCVTGPRNPK